MAGFIIPETIGLILLASGQSKRMGVNKLLLPVGKAQEACVRHVAKLLVDIAPKRVLAVYHEEAVKNEISDLALETVYNANALLGQSESIKLGVSHNWPETVQAFAFVMGDQPLLSREIFETLFREFCRSDANIAVPCVGVQQFSPVIFHRSWTNELLKLTGDKGAKGLMSHPKANVLRVAFSTNDGFEDMDTPEAYQAVQAKLSQLENGGEQHFEKEERNTRGETSGD